MAPSGRLDPTELATICANDIPGAARRGLARISSGLASISSRITLVPVSGPFRPQG